jgi:hypothetical protein
VRGASHTLPSTRAANRAAICLRERASEKTVGTTSLQPDRKLQRHGHATPGVKGLGAAPWLEEGDEGAQLLEVRMFRVGDAHD